MYVSGEIDDDPNIYENIPAASASTTAAATSQKPLPAIPTKPPKMSVHRPMSMTLSHDAKPLSTVDADKKSKSIARGMDPKQEMAIRNYITLHNFK